jgi:hypothetical protein
MRISPLLVESVVNPQNLRNQNLYTIVAPSFKGDPYVSFFAIPFAWYIGEVQKESSLKFYILDVTVPYGEINGWPIEILDKERQTKINTIRRCFDLFEVDYKVIYLEKELKNTLFNRMMNKYLNGIYLRELKSKAESSLELKVDEKLLNRAKNVSYENKVGLPITENELKRRVREYEILRIVEFSYITKKYYAIPIKQGNPKDDETLDVSIYENEIPRIYLIKQKNSIGSRIFRVENRERVLTIGDSLEEFNNKLKDKYNLMIAAIASLGYKGKSIEDVERRIKLATTEELIKEAKEAWYITLEVW